MTLIEKFHQWLKTEPFSSKERPTLREAQCAEIAYDYAIEFADWLNYNCYRSFNDDWWLIKKEGDVKKTSKQLLEIFKKEKGL